MLIIKLITKTVNNNKNMRVWNLYFFLIKPTKYLKLKIVVKMLNTNLKEYATVKLLLIKLCKNKNKQKDFCAGAHKKKYPRKYDNCPL